MCVARLPTCHPCLTLEHGGTAVSVGREVVCGCCLGLVVGGGRGSGIPFASCCWQRVANSELGPSLAAENPESSGLLVGRGFPTDPVAAGRDSDLNDF